MNLLNQYMPSMNRIYGGKFNDLRSSFSTLLIVLDGVTELILKGGEREEQDAKLRMLSGTAYRHFQLENERIGVSEYEGAESHIDKHCGFLQQVEMFQLEFAYNTQEQNLAAARNLQRWLSTHLLMDDAHLISNLS